MKIRLTESQIKMLSENLTMSGNTVNAINALKDPNTVNQVTNNLNKIKQVVKSFNLPENNDTEDGEYEDDEPAVRMEMEDHIDELLRGIYGFTYFKDYSKPGYTRFADTLFPEKVHGQKVPFYQTMTPEQKTNVEKTYPKVMAFLKSGNPEKLSTLFTALIRKSQKQWSGLDEGMYADDYVDALTQDHPNGITLTDANQIINDFMENNKDENMTAIKLYRILSGLVEKGVLKFQNGTPVTPDSLDKIIDNSDYLSRMNMRKGHNIAFKTIPSFGLNENNFENSEIFRIIAEAEKPRLTKKEFINYLKTKK